jgi:hypothetical protein
MDNIMTILLWSLIGAGLLNIVVFIFSRTNVIYTKYDRNGELKKKVPLKGGLFTLLMLVLIIAFFMGFDYFMFRDGPTPAYPAILGVNTVLLLLLDLYDAFFIDLFVLGWWKPGFLHLRDYYSLRSMQAHVKRQFTRAWALKIPLLLVSSLCFWLLAEYMPV